MGRRTRRGRELHVQGANERREESVDQGGERNPLVDLAHVQSSLSLSLSRGCQNAHAGSRLPPVQGPAHMQAKTWRREALNVEEHACLRSNLSRVD